MLPLSRTKKEVNDREKPYKKKLFIHEHEWLQYVFEGKEEQL
jgi:hypothetical protein